MKKGFFIFIMFLPFALNAEIILENGALKAVFNEKTGALEHLISKSTGWPIQRRAGLAQSFHMSVPLPGQRFNPVAGEKQATPEVHFDKANQQIDFIWSTLRSKNGGELPIRFTGTVRLTNSGLVYTARIENNSPYTVETVAWPMLGDLSLPPKAEYLAQLGMDYGGMRRLELYPKFANEPGYFAVDYPMQWLKTPDTPFSLIDSGCQGLYVGYHDTTVEHMVKFTARLIPGYVSYELWDTGVNPKTDSIAGQPVRLEFSTVHFPFVNSGESVELHPIVLQPYQGDWHSGADLYKKWRKTWFKAPTKPDWFAQVHSWQQIHMNNPEDDIRYTYKDLVKIGEDCARHGVKAIQVTGWTIGGQDGGNPSHDIDPRLGTWDDLHDAIDAVQKMGVKIILFNKYTWADRTLDRYRNELLKYATKDPYGDPHYHSGYAYQTATQLAEINTHRFSPMCHLAAAWRKIANKEFIKSINLGADGMLYDENQHHGGARYCFDKTHGHHVPAHIYAGDAMLAEGFHRISDRLKPDYLYAGEGNYDLEFRHYHLSYFRVDLNHVPLHRYVAPDEEMMITVAGYNDRNMINLALMDRYIISYEPRNFKGRLDEFPLTIAYGKRVDALRRRYDDFFWHGEFRHTVGARVTAGGEPYRNYAVFLNRKTGKKAAVIVNYDYNNAVAIQIHFFAKETPLVQATPEHPDAVLYTDSVTIPPNSVVLVMER
ncbi:MAG: hypothetical protein GXO75_04530 [Calditrichaeota bacterium]|nr:hypothetical protein [Calditrichota bacterium]